MRLAILAVLVLSACAAPQYHRVAGNADFQQSLHECNFEAKKTAATIRDMLQAAMIEGQIMSVCMRAKGFAL